MCESGDMPLQDDLHSAVMIISERELTFTFAIGYTVRLSVVRLSVCLSVTFGRPQAIEIFRNVSTPYDTLASC